MSKRTVQAKIDNAKVAVYSHQPREVMVVMDTTYFGKVFGVLVARDVYQKENLYWKFVRYETIAGYQEAVSELQRKGFKVLGLTVDGRRGIFKAFPGIPIQMCQFHQKQIVKRYITDNPKLEASIELKRIVDLLTQTDEVSFNYWLDKWFFKWRYFLNERTEDIYTGRSHFTHQRLRRAYNSLRSHLPYLFTCQKYFKLRMPNTCNSLDGFFSQMKTKIKVHRGLRVDRKMKLIDEFMRKE